MHARHCKHDLESCTPNSCALFTSKLDKSAVAVAIARQTREDLERGEISVAGLEKGYYLLLLGMDTTSAGESSYCVENLEQALEIAQGQDQTLAFHAFNNMALIYDAMGKLREALNLYKTGFYSPGRRWATGAGEAAALNNMAMVYQNLGQPQQALALYEQALPITRALDKHEGEAATLSNMAMVLKATGQPQRALELYEQALSIQREIGNRVGEATTLNTWPWCTRL